MKNSFFLTFITLFIFSSCQEVERNEMGNMITKFESLEKEFENDASWPVFETEKLEAKEEKLKAYLEELSAMDVSVMTEADRINKDMLELIVTDDIESMRFGIHEFPLNAEGGFLTGIIYSINGIRLHDDASKKSYIKKLKALPDYIDHRMEHLKSGLARGVVSPKLITELCRSMVDEVANAEADQTFFLNSARGTSLEDEVRQIVNEDIIPAYQKLSKYLSEEYLPQSQDKIGVREITGGEEYYKHRVRYFATDNISPQEVFDLGMEEVRRIREEMESIIEQVGFEGSFEEFQNFLRTSPQFYAKSPEEILTRAAWITKQMEGELPKYFGKLPRMPLTVKPVPAAIAPNYTSGRYSPGSYANKKAGEYWVNTTKLESRPLYALPALSLHEGVPGHHTQIMLASELEMPDFRRNTYLSAFGEGWALYCEYLGKEAGMYTTAYEDYGRLVYEMWRACRLVVDPGMHYLGWTRERAFDFMKENTALSILEINNEINRYIGWPAQAISYKLGELKIKELRIYAQDELGEDFDITAFHDTILGNGSVPLNTLERIIQTWVESQKKV